MNFDLYYAALRADKALSDALTKKFGKRAGDARYEAATYRDDLQLAILGKRKMDADDAWQEHVKEQRLCSNS